MDYGLSALHRDEGSIKKPVKATYYPSASGLRLARVESFSRPVFISSGWELPEKLPIPVPPSAGVADPDDPQRSDPAANLRRAIRRAKLLAYDLIMSNPDLDLFVTLTYSPEIVENKQNYAETYSLFSHFASNNTQRRGFKYVGVPELTKAGDVHFHLLCNSAALDLAPAVNPHNGHKIYRNGKQVFNIPLWKSGFSTAQKITPEGGADDFETLCKCAKYLFKYMGKSVGNKIGGRHILHGGKLSRPVSVLADTVEEIAADHVPTYKKTVELFDGKISYNCLYFT